MDTRTVVAPDGSRWRVRRRWLERPLPGLRRRWRRVQADSADAWDLGMGFDALTGGVFAALVIAVVIVSVLLLGAVLEVVGLLLVLASGLFARVVLRRPWIVVGEDLGDRERRVAFAVVGWRDSVQATRELREAIAAAGPPERLSVGRPLATRPQVAG